MQRVDIFGILFAVTDYENASEVIVENARQNKSFGVSALAVHGLITSYTDNDIGDLVKTIDLIVPDGQPIRWAMNVYHKVGMKDRVSGPTLTLHVLKKASKLGLKLYLYGSTSDTLEKYSNFITKNYHGIKIVGLHVDRFREATPKEDLADIEKINQSEAQIVLVGRGCPRQEKWVALHQDKIPAVLMAVGAAFDFHSGKLKHAPIWMQNSGLEWLFRLAQEPRRLFKRYFTTNSYFMYLFIKHYFNKKYRTI
ncbi:MAG TPA: glycosyltransferase [Flavobacteriales bacterium]|nr:glycosyltransferase [Flavobacteriales bacterium]HIO67403.1 glycosyltransferase [Flavobacteriales bacterium]